MAKQYLHALIQAIYNLPNFKFIMHNWIVSIFLVGPNKLTKYLFSKIFDLHLGKILKLIQASLILDNNISKELH